MTSGHLGCHIGYYTVIWSAAVQYLIYLARESRYWAKRKLSPILSPLPNKSDIGQAADQTTVLLFPPRILVYVSLTIMRSNYVKTYKPVHRAQLKKTSFNSQTFQWPSFSRWFDQQRVGWQKSHDVYLVTSHAIYQKLYSICCSNQA